MVRRHAQEVLDLYARTVAAFPFRSLWLLMPGFLLQSVGLGIVLTVNDPTTLGSVPSSDQGQAPGVNDTGEQLGGAVGIALFSALLVYLYYGRFPLPSRRTRLASDAQPGRSGTPIRPPRRAEGPEQHHASPFMRDAIRDFEVAHVYAYQLTFSLMGLVAIAGAVVCRLLVRKTTTGPPPTTSPGARGKSGPARGKDQG